MPRVEYCYWPQAWQALGILIESLGLNHIDPCRVSVVASNSSSTAVARIWGLQRVFQKGFQLHPLYVIEVVWPRFSRLDCRSRVEALVHELAHIPRTFSGGLAAHTDTFHRRLREYRMRLRSLPEQTLQTLCRLLTTEPWSNCSGKPCQNNP